MENGTSSMERPQRVKIYSTLMAPAPNTHGAGLVLFSQVQAFLDLGCEVEYVNLQTRDDFFSLTCDCFDRLAYSVVDARTARPTSYTRLACWAGWPASAAWRHIFYAREVLRREAEKRILADPSAIHVFNFLRTANVIPSLPKARTIWVCHEIESDFHLANSAIDQEIDNRKASRWEKRRLRRFTTLERQVARSSSLIVCAAHTDARRIREEWSISNVGYLPFTIAYADRPLVSPGARVPGVLRLLHIGGLEHPPTYSSLEFLLTKVFPLLDRETLSKLKLEVVGRSHADGKWTQALVEMARPYPMVQFSGFIDDIRDAYRRSDLQVVASTKATGVRTRIVESWAYGMPVLSTTVAADGVDGLEPGRNILIADDPREFARALEALVRDSSRLDEIAAAARQSYEANFGRQAVAHTLRELLNARFGLQLAQAPKRAHESPDKLEMVPQGLKPC